MRTLMEDGARKVLAGVTSIEEVLPVFTRIRCHCTNTAPTMRPGRLFKGLIDAPSDSSAHDRIKQRGLFPSTIAEDVGAGGGRQQAFGETLAFTRIQPATLLRAVFPACGPGVHLLPGPGARFLQQALVRAGVRLSEGKQVCRGPWRKKALSSLPLLTIRLVEAGNTVGELETILERYAQFTERQEVSSARS